MLRSLILLNIFISRDSCCCHQTLDQLFTARPRQPGDPRWAQRAARNVGAGENWFCGRNDTSPLLPECCHRNCIAGAVVPGSGASRTSQAPSLSPHIASQAAAITRGKIKICVKWRRGRLVIIHWLAINIVAHYSEF